jgi:hypothetical protein
MNVFEFVINPDSIYKISAVADFRTEPAIGCGKRVIKRFPAKICESAGQVVEVKQTVSGDEPL